MHAVGLCVNARLRVQEGKPRRKNFGRLDSSSDIALKVDIARRISFYAKFMSFACG